MGAVYEARQDQPRRSVALKVIRGGLFSAQQLRRFEIEAEVLGRLQHPGIAQIYEARTAETGSGALQPFFAMELIRGLPLTQYCDRNSLGLRERLRLLAEICNAVQHAHQRGVIHRDLKPANILVDETGQPKILDFGVARATDEDVRSATLQTDVGQLVGTLPYMSPEQAAGDPTALDTRSDVYSLGVVGYELLTGHLPYDLTKRSLPDAARVIREEEPSSIGGHDAALRGDVETILLKALEKDRDRRYATASALEDDLRSFLGNRPIAARPPSRIYTLRKFARRNRGLVAGASAVFVALVVGLLFSVHFARQAVRSAAEAEAVNDFLNQDLLAAVAPSGKAGTGRDVLMRDVLDEAAGRLDDASAPGGRFEGRPLVEARIRWTLGDTYRALGDHDAAEIHLLRAQDLRLQELPDGHDDVLKVMNGLARISMEREQPERAVALLRTIVERSTASQGERHPRTVVYRTNLAWALSAIGELEEAETMMTETLAAQRETLGDRDPATLFSINNLASRLTVQGRHEEAGPLLHEALTGMTEVLGAEDPNTMNAMHNLANHYKDVGDADRSVELFREVLELRRRALGPDHLQVAATHYSLGLAELERKAYPEAAASFRAAIELHEAQLGPENGATLMSRTAYAYLFLMAEDEDWKRPAEAREILLEVNEASNYSNPWHVATLARAEFENGSVDLAIETLVNALEILPDGYAARAEWEALLAEYRAAR